MLIIYLTPILSKEEAYSETFLTDSDGGMMVHVNLYLISSTTRQGTRMIKQVIETKLAEGFSPKFLQVINESYMHNVPEGSESHFKVVVVSEKFEGQRLVARHRSVNHILSEELANHIHALSIKAYTPNEWQESGQIIPDSPPCMGGDKK